MTNRTSSSRVASHNRGMRELEEVMRLSEDFNPHARELAALYGSLSVVTAGSGVAPSTEPTTAAHAHVG
jgi:hypothetical protein